MATNKTRRAPGGGPVSDEALGRGFTTRVAR